MISVPEDLPDWLNVSRETLEDLRAFCRFVEKWNPAINLVSKTGLVGLWDRHVLDSAQIFPFVPPEAKLWCDLGSGGGFPGLVIAVMAKHELPNLEVVLVESDRRKSVFLSEVARLMKLRVQVRVERIENLEPQNADILSARALAPLSTLCGFASRHMKSDGLAIFPKGVNATEEIREARQTWAFDLMRHTSRTEAGSAVLLLRGIHHV